ncbi:hypothetical protein IV38_GL001951 [Lactobacillus selangorensis]|uniref:Uncharacterized protein n=1 Tax=Lactobacillus selangorensis TaxID=81857 RepID=A0A0R2FGH3_9LACO|nr:hypothetical protein IV38_GL001951 [Lactobacillus selangorensis]KRN30298.1 hypothetical protein IV40_GL001886 [Lactobacillus selangorensis]
MIHSMKKLDSMVDDLNKHLDYFPEGKIYQYKFTWSDISDSNEDMQVVEKYFRGLSDEKKISYSNKNETLTMIDSFLLKNRNTFTPPTLAKKLGIGVADVYKHYALLGIKDYKHKLRVKNSRAHFKQFEDNFIVANYGQMSIYEMTRNIHHGAGAIKKEIAKLISNGRIKEKATK